MNNKTKISNNNSKTLICPICGDIMNEDLYAYDNSKIEKINFKCPICGHKEVKII